MCEVFLLRLCLKFRLGIWSEELAKDLRDCAVQMIIGFRNYYFLDALLWMLLEPVLPVSSLLGCQDEVHLRQILYDAVLSVEYSCLTSQRGIELPCKNLKNLAVRWLLVLDNALWSARDNSNQAKVISYINAFSESFLTSELINWVMHQTGIGRKTGTPNISSPVTLIKWLLTVEDQGVRVFDCEISKIYAKAMVCKSRVEYEVPMIIPNGKNLHGNIFFYTNKEERRNDKVDTDLEMVDTVDTEFLAVADRTRKRKEGQMIEGEIPVKFVRYHFHDYSASENFSPLGNDDGLSSWNKVDNPVSDEYMEDLKQ